MDVDPLYYGFRLGLGVGAALLVCYMLALSTRELGAVARMIGEWAGARRARKRLERWAGRENIGKVRKIG